MVTARHEVGFKVRDCCHTLLEVEGFTKTDAKEFIQRYFRKEEDLAEKLLDKLYSDRSLQNLTANPLNTALLCLLFEDFRGKFPGSRTLLYLEIVECVLRRYRGSPIGFFNPAIPTGIFPQSRNPDGFYRLIPVPVIFSLPQQKRSLKYRSRFPHGIPSRPNSSTDYLVQLAVSLCTKTMI